MSFTILPVKSWERSQARWQQGSEAAVPLHQGVCAPGKGQVKANVHTTGSKRARALLEIEDSGDSDPGGWWWGWRGEELDRNYKIQEGGELHSYYL